MGNDNRDAISIGLTLSAQSDPLGIAEISFQVSRHPGDNYKVYASTSSHAVHAVTQNMADGHTDPDFCVAESEMLTVWRHLNVELDSMKAIGEDENKYSGHFKHFHAPLGWEGGNPTATAVGQIDTFDPPMTEAPLIFSDVEQPLQLFGFGGGFTVAGLHTMANDQEPPQPPPFISMNDEQKILIHQGFSMVPLPYTATDWIGAATMSGQATAIIKNGSQYVLALDVEQGAPVDWGAFLGGEISIGGGPSVLIVDTNDSQGTFSTSELGIPFTARDDDDRKLLPRTLDFSLMEQIYGEAYVLPLNNGGGNPAFSKVEVPFNPHLVNVSQVGQSHQQSRSKERADHWVVYAFAAFHELVKNDRDWDPLESAGMGVTTGSGWTESAIFVEVIREAFSAGIAEAATLCHEIGHQFNLAHPDPPDGYIMDESFSTMQHLNFSPNHLAQIRDRVQSP